MKIKTIGDLTSLTEALNGEEEAVLYTNSSTYKIKLSEIDHNILKNKGINSHEVIDNFIASKGQPGGLAVLDLNGEVGQNADLLDGFHASKNAQASEIPVLTDNQALLIGLTDDGVNKLQVNGSVKMQSGKIGLLLGADQNAETLTNATNKVARIATPHYDNTEEPFIPFMASSSSSTNSLLIGGGASIGNSATEIRFYSSQNNSTLTGTERMRITPLGNILIGTTNDSTYRINISNSKTDEDCRGQYLAINPTITASAAREIYGLFINSQVYNLSSGVTNSGNIVGLQSNTYINSDSYLGTTTNQYGIISKAGIYNCGLNGTITNSYGLHTEIYNNDSYGTITNAYGLYIKNDNTTGTITNRWGIYQTGATANNYLAGKLLVGTNIDNGVDTLQVSGTVSFGSAFKTNSSGQVRWGSGEQGILSWDTTYASITANTGIALRIGHINGTGLNISTGNNILIGTTTDDATNKLQVTGSALFTNAITSNRTVNSLGTFTNTSYPNGMYVSGSNSVTVNGTYPVRCVDLTPQFSITSGITNSGSVIGVYSEIMRNSGLANDNGTQLYQYSGLYYYGHNNGFAANPLTTDAFGIMIKPYIRTGTITNMYDLYLAADITGGAVTNRWGIYQANTAKNFFAGSVLIGSTKNNGYKLQVEGVLSAQAAAFGCNASTADVSVCVGEGRTGDGNAFIDLVGDTTYVDYGLRLRRFSGENGSSALSHRGTGCFSITALEAGYITLNTQNLERVRIAPDGKVGIGTVATGAQFHVLAPKSDTIADIARFEQYNAANTDGARLIIQADAANNLVRLQSTGSSAGGFAFLSATTESARLTASGNLLIGTSTDDAVNKLQVNGSAKISGDLEITGDLIGYTPGAVGGGTDSVFFENDQIITTSYTITSGKNALSAGPITINTNITVTIPEGSTWSII